MRILVALGGNALLRRGESMDVENQRLNVAAAASALAPLAKQHELIITHGNGPQVGLLALQAAAYKQVAAYPLDILDAESEGMIGYMIEQAMMNQLGDSHNIATLLTQVEVDAGDSAFRTHTKPIGPVYDKHEAERLCRDRGWQVIEDGDGYRRVVASPMPLRILEIEVIKLLVEHGVVVICNGGGGIPVVKRGESTYVGVEAVVDKDRSSALLASQLAADALLMLTDVDGVWLGWRSDSARRIRKVHPDFLDNKSFEAGTMGPKIEAASFFARQGSGFAAIGALHDAQAMLNGDAGTIISCESESMELCPESQLVRE